MVALNFAKSEIKGSRLTKMNSYDIMMDINTLIIYTLKRSDICRHRKPYYRPIFFFSA